MKKTGSIFWKDTLKTVLVALIFSAVFVLGVSILLSFVPLSDTVLTVVDQVVKVLSLLFASLLCFKDKSKGAVKGLLCGVLYALFSLLLFGLAQGKTSFSVYLLADVGFGALIGLISGSIAVMVSKKKL